MFPTIGHLINALFGTEISFPLPTYGLLLALSFLAAYYVARYGMMRKQKQGFLYPFTVKEIKGKKPVASDLIPPALFGFLLGWKFIGLFFHYPLFNNDPASYFFSMNGSWLAGFALAGALSWFEYRKMKKQQLPKPIEESRQEDSWKLMPQIMVIAAAGGIAGAKLFHILENLDDFAKAPMATLFSTGGLTFYGGLIAGTLLVIVFLMRRKLSVIHMMDVTAPAILIAYAVGRVGCMLAGDGCWGIENTLPKPEWLSFLPNWMWAFNFPHNVVNEGVILHDCSGKYCHVLENPVFPTPFYETTINLIFAGILLLIGRRAVIPGILFAYALIMNGVARFFVEKIRVNNTFNFFGGNVTQAEVISVLLVITGILLIFWLRKQAKQT